MTEKDLEIQRLRRENEALKKIAFECVEPCDYCKHTHNLDYCEAAKWKCDGCPQNCICRNCAKGQKWELANGK